MRFVVLVLALVAPALLGGCASVTRGWTEQIQINSEPAGAEVRTSMAQACTTPCTLQVSRKDEFSVSISKPGYEPQSIPVTTRVAGGGAAGFAGNILLGGVIGMGVDAASGAALEHYPNPIMAQLRPLPPAYPPPRVPAPRGKGKPQPGIVQRAPVVQPIAQPVSYAPPAPPEPTLSEADRDRLNRTMEPQAEYQSQRQ